MKRIKEINGIKYYKGVELHPKCKIQHKTGKINESILKGIDSLIEVLEKNEHTLESQYLNNTEPIEINVYCEIHKGNQKISAQQYKKNQNCIVCGKLKSGRKKGI